VVGTFAQSSKNFVVIVSAYSTNTVTPGTYTTKLIDQAKQKKLKYYKKFKQ